MDLLPKGEIVWRSSETVSLVRVKPGNGIAVVRTGHVIAWYMHWLPDFGRTQPCQLAKCPHCPTGAPRRALSYCSVMHYTHREGKPIWLPAILEIPFGCGHVLGDLPKQRVALTRTRKCGQVNIGTYLFECDMPKLLEFDIVPHLMRMWRLPINTALALVGNLGPGHD